MSGDGGAAQIARDFDSGAAKKTKLTLGTCDCYLGIATRIAYGSEPSVRRCARALR